VPFSIEFEKHEVYRSLEPGITIGTTLHYGGQTLNCEAKVDTGSEVCLFSRDCADALEIDIEKGFKETFRTLTGHVAAFAHDMEIETLGLRLETIVFFAESYDIKRNLLGRQGWLQLLRLGLIDYNSSIFIGRY